MTTTETGAHEFTPDMYTTLTAAKQQAVHEWLAAHGEPDPAKVRRVLVSFNGEDAVIEIIERRGTPGPNGAFAMKDVSLTYRIVAITAPFPIPLPYTPRSQVAEEKVA